MWNGHNVTRVCKDSTVSVNASPVISSCASWLETYTLQNVVIVRGIDTQPALNKQGFVERNPPPHKAVESNWNELLYKEKTKMYSHRIRRNELDDEIFGVHILFIIRLPFFYFYFLFSFLFFFFSFFSFSSFFFSRNILIIMHSKIGLQRANPFS